MAAHNHKKLAQEITALHQFISDTQFRHYQLRSVSKLDHPDWFEFKFSHNEPKCDTGITYYYNYKENAVIHTFGLDFHFSPDSQYIFMGGCNEMYSEPTYLLNLNIAQNMLSKEASFDWGCFESIKWDGPNVLVQLAYPSRIWQKKRYIIQKDADEWVVLDNEPINQHLEN